MFKRHLKLIRWFIVIVGGVLAGLWILLLSLSNTDALREKLIEALNKKLDAEVELANFSVKTFPRFRIHGEHLDFEDQPGERRHLAGTHPAVPRWGGM